MGRGGRRDTFSKSLCVCAFLEESRRKECNCLFMVKEKKKVIKEFLYDVGREKKKNRKRQRT